MRMKPAPVAAVVQGIFWLSLGCLKGPNRDTPDSSSNQPHSTGEGGSGANTGGTPNKPLRPTSPNVTLLDPGVLSSPKLPALAEGGYYRVLTFDSANETGFTFTAANSTGYSLFAASSPKLVEDARALDPSTTFNPVFVNGSRTAGAYNGSNKDLISRASTGGKPVLLSGYSRSAAPAALLTVADGQTVTVAADDIGDGDGMLWLFFTASGATHKFVLVSAASSDPKLTVTDATVTERDTETANATFTVSLSAAAASTVTVKYDTISGTATAGINFTETRGTLTFLPGETKKTVTVVVSGGATHERDVDFFLTLASATNAVIADGVGLGTIQTDDAQPTIAINHVPRAEGNIGSTQFVFTVTLSNPSWQTITVAFATADGSATAGVDYEATSGTLTFQPGQTTRTIVVTVNGDTTDEPGPAFPPPGLGEKFFVNLSGPVNATLLDAQGSGLIQDDD